MKLRIIDKSRLKIQFQFEIKDLWIGVFWQYKSLIDAPYHNIIHIYICFIPLLPLHITILCKPLRGE